MAGGKTKESFHILGSAQFFSGGEQNDSTGIFTWKHSESILMRQFWQFPPVSSVCDEEAGLPPYWLLSPAAVDPPVNSTSHTARIRRSVPLHCQS